MPHRTSTPHSHSLSGSDDQLLRAVYAYHFLTVDQVVRLFYRHGSLAYVRVRLKRLADEGYLQRLRLPQPTSGNPPWIYTLAQHGASYLKASGCTEFVSFRDDAQQHSWLFLHHTLAVNDVLIAAALLTRVVPEVTLVDMRHERTLRHYPVKVAIDGGRETMTLVPDGWLDFHVRASTRVSVLLELDMGTIEQKAFKRKLRGLLAFLAGPYQEAFGSASVSVAFATTAGAARAERIRVWIEQVLREQRSEQEAELFLVANLPTGELDPNVVFCLPYWRSPFSSSVVSLLEP